MTNPTNLRTPSKLSALPDSPEKLNDLRIKHTRIGQMMSELETLIYPKSQDSILLVCGPSGVGKSTLAKHMVENALQKASTEMDRNAGLIPAVYIEAPSSGETDFSWRLFYQQILQQLEGDFDMPKVAYGIDAETGRMMRPRGATGNSLGALRTAVERALRARQTRFLVIDEAAHIIRQTRRDRLEIQLDTLKSLANRCGTQMVLVGSYDLYQLMSLSGQLARRTHVLHFERYRQDHDADLRAFRACVQKFQNALPHLWGEQLMPHAGALQENTLGCVGTLSAVLTRAAMLAQKDGGWSVDALRRALLTEAQRHQILEEILEGEAAINPGMTRTMRHTENQKPHREERNVA
jgi:energy-coupling factor transporter ATP-binding protein EcfA2